MEIHCYVGVRDNADVTVARLRYVHSDGHPLSMLPTLRELWNTTANRDTNRLVELLLNHDWDYLDPAVTDATPVTTLGQYPVAGIGVTLASANADDIVDPPRPVTIVPVHDLGALIPIWARWVYLLDLVNNRVACYDDGRMVTIQPLAR